MKLSITRWQARAIQFILIPVAASRLLFYPLGISGVNALIVGAFTIIYWYLIRMIDCFVPEPQPAAVSRFDIKQTATIELPDGWRLNQGARRDSIVIANSHTSETITVYIKGKSVMQIQADIHQRLTEHNHD